MRLFQTTVAIAALATLATAQHLVDIDPFAGNAYDQATSSPLIAAPVPATYFYPGFFPPPVGPGPSGLPPGDSTLDGAWADNWWTDGLTVFVSPTVAYLGPPPPPPIPIGLGPILTQPVTGMALDPIKRSLWLTDGVVVAETAPIPGTPVLSWFWAPAPFVGLEWDPMTSNLLAVDPPGTVFTLTTTGILLGTIPPPPPMGIAEDVAIDKTGMVNPGGVRSVYVLMSGLIFDVANPNQPPLPAGSQTSMGLAFHPHPAANPPVGGCLCGTFTALTLTNSPMVAGNAGFGVTVTGVPPGNFVLFAFDFNFNPAFPLINGTGCPFGFNLFSPTIATGSGVAGPTGNVTFPLSLALVPPGTGPVYNQNATICPADPAGFTLTPMLQIAVSGM